MSVFRLFMGVAVGSLLTTVVHAQTLSTPLSTGAYNPGGSLSTEADANLKEDAELDRESASTNGVAKTEQKQGEAEKSKSKSKSDEGAWSAQRRMWGSGAAYSRHWQDSLVGREAFGAASGDLSEGSNNYGTGSSYGGGSAYGPGSPYRSGSSYGSSGYGAGSPYSSSVPSSSSYGSRYGSGSGSGYGGGSGASGSWSYTQQLYGGKRAN